MRPKEWHALGLADLPTTAASMPPSSTSQPSNPGGASQPSHPDGASQPPHPGGVSQCPPNHASSSEKDSEEGARRRELLKQAPIVPFGNDLYHWEENIEAPLIQRFVPLRGKHRSTTHTEVCTGRKTLKHHSYRGLYHWEENIEAPLIQRFVHLGGSGGALQPEIECQLCLSDVHHLLFLRFSSE